ncbi:MAG: hypothetical protein ACI97X_002043 [Oceanospirillaceae bacterium]|jgi:hypothetical protein
MKNDFETKFTGWAMITGALMLLFGWVLLPHHIGEYLVVEDFAAVEANFWTWIWLYRMHIFGWVIMGGSMMGFASLTFKRPYRILLMPGAGVIIVGTFTSALATAYYYSYGAWGIGQTADKSPEEIQTFMDGILYTNHYVTCMVRFGRVFSGAGLVLMGAGLLTWKVTDTWLGAFTVLLGLAAMGIVMLIPVNYEIYKPVFYVKVLWLFALGVTILRKGLNLPDEV